ncbi:MAG: metallophosphoesterase [Holophagaceae bacterium]|nr:metallophosphoesterase [Holophagaceae bacterium]
MERRDFLASIATAAAASQLALRGAEGSPDPRLASRITLLHTNDTHSHIDPFGPGSGQASGKGGMARRSTMVKQLRASSPNLLLLDAGDTFQGTPYFNQYKGKLDFELMSKIGYDASTLGNHDFDNGIAMLLEAMAFATFPFLNCNFDCKGAPALAARLSPWLVKEFPGFKVGLTGVGVDFQGLVSPENHKGVEWRAPEEALKPVIRHLRETEKVDLVVLLSHLGYDLQGDAIDDLTLAKQVPGIDAIIGGHSHTFLDQPTKIQQERGETHVFQVGWGGINLGRMDFAMSKGQVRAASGMPMPVSALA